MEKRKIVFETVGGAENVGLKKLVAWLRNKEREEEEHGSSTPAVAED